MRAVTVIPISQGDLDVVPEPRLARHNVGSDGLCVEAEFSAGGTPNRITDVTVHITSPAALPKERRDAFLAVASHCTLHNTLSQPPTVEIRLDIPNDAR